MEQEKQSKNIIEQQLSSCDQLIKCAKIISSSVSIDSEQLFRESALALISLKNQNRKIYLSIDSKRTEVEKHRDRVDRLQLDLENLMYKQAFLTREIRSCKDLSTPELDNLESELGLKIGASEFTYHLESTHATALETMSEETAARKVMLAQLQHLNQKYQNSLDRLDRKRKFIDELPTRVALVKAATSDLGSLFAGMTAEDQLQQIA